MTAIGIARVPGRNLRIDDTSPWPVLAWEVQQAAYADGWTDARRPVQLDGEVAELAQRIGRKIDEADEQQQRAWWLGYAAGLADPGETRRTVDPDDEYAAGYVDGAVKAVDAGYRAGVRDGQRLLSETAAEVLEFTHRCPTCGGGQS